MMTKTELWFENLKDIWLRKAAEEVGGLMSKTFEYYEEPFAEAVTNTGDLVEEWKEVKNQDIKTLEIVPLVCTETEGTASYHFVATIDGEEHESKGVYYVKLDSNGKAVEFRQWWNNK